MDFSTEFWIQILVLTGGIAGIWGGQRQSINYIKDSIDKLERKQDKHNNLIERMSLVEASARSAHKRIDAVLDDCKLEKQYKRYYKEDEKC